MSPAAAPESSDRSTLSNDMEDSVDLENESRSAFNVRQSVPPTVKKQLFHTPAAQPAKLTLSRTRKSPATPKNFRLDKSSITKRYYRRQTSSTTTPHATRPAPRPTMSTARKRPSISRLHTTPGMRRKYVSMTPDMWRKMQIDDLTAWLNSELGDSSLSSSCPAMDNISDSAIFLKQVSDMHHLYKSAEIEEVLSKVDKEIRQARFFVSKKIHLSTHHEHRERLISLILLNYHPTWLLVGLCAILGFNFGASLDDAIKKAKSATPRMDSERVFMSVLEHAIRTHLLADDRPGIDVDKVARADKRKSLDSLKRESYNGLVLQRILRLIFLLDQAKQSRHPIILTDPPLFRCGSEMISSKDVIEQMGKDFLPDQGNVVRFLAHRLYKVTYVTPLFERDSLAVRNLFEDLRDGTRLCKLASIMVKDRKLLSNIRRVNNGMSSNSILTCHLGNVSLALNKMQEYATTHVQSSFEWRGSHQDIVNQKMQKTTSLLWQVAGLWLETMVLDKDQLRSELKIVQQECREARKQPSMDVWSPSSGAMISDAPTREISPSRLTVYETCESECGHLLLRWCATVSHTYGLTVRDFCESFRDGAVLCLILHHYCPELIRADEITPVQQAELRSVTDSEAEATLVQRNFDLFTERSRSLGAIPYIPIRAEAALAPSFVSRDKDDSFGRVMELLSSYLFRRLVMEKERRGDREYVKQFVSQEQRSKAQSEGLVHDGFMVSTPEGTKDTEGVTAGTPLATSVMSVAVRDDDDCAPDERHSEEENALKAQGEVKQVHRSIESEPNSPLLEHIDASETGEASLRSPYSLRREEAARVIIRYYRAAKSRQQYLRKRDAVVNIQAGIRAFMVRERVGVQSPDGVKRSQLETSPLPTRLYLKTWPAVSSADSGLKAFSRDGSEVKLGFESQRPGRVVEQVSNLLPVLRQQIEKTSLFAERMMKLENSQPVVPGHIPSPAHRPDAAVDAPDPNGNNIESSTSTLRSFASGVFGVARSIAKSFASEVDAQRKSYVATLVGALQAAENAYEGTMKQAAIRAEHERVEQRRRHDETTTFRQAQANEELQHQVDLHNEHVSVDRSLSDLNTRVDESEEFLERLSCRDNDANIDDFVSSLDVLADVERTSQADEGDSVYPLQDTLDISTTETTTLRTQERGIESEIDQLHADWQMDLVATEEELRYWKILSLKSGLYKAMLEFASYMNSASESRSRNLARNERLSSAISCLDVEQNHAKETCVSDFKNLDDELRSLDLRHSEQTSSVSREGEETEHVFTRLESAMRSFESAREKDRLTESIFQSAVDGIDKDVTELAGASEDYQIWLSNSESIDQMLDEEIHKQEDTERRIERENLLSKALHSAEEQFDSVMDKKHKEAAVNAKARAERESEFISIEKQEENDKQKLNVEFASLDDARNRTETLMIAGASLVESLTTPVRSQRFPAVAASPAHPSGGRISLSPNERHVLQLRSDIDQTLAFIDGERASILACGDERIAGDGSVTSTPQHALQTALESAEIFDTGAPASGLRMTTINSDAGEDDGMPIMVDEGCSRNPMANSGIGDPDDDQSVSPVRCEKSTSRSQQNSSSASSELADLAVAVDALSGEAAPKSYSSVTPTRPSHTRSDSSTSHPKPCSSSVVNGTPHSTLSARLQPEFGTGFTPSLSERRSAGHTDEADNFSLHDSPSYFETSPTDSFRIEPSDVGIVSETNSTPLPPGSNIPMLSPNSPRADAFSLEGSISPQRYHVEDAAIAEFSVESRKQSHPALAEREQFAFDRCYDTGKSSLEMSQSSNPETELESGVLSARNFSEESIRRPRRELQRLSSQLDELTVGNVSLDNVDSLIQDPASSQKLNSVLRRISIATSSPSIKDAEHFGPDRRIAEEESPVTSIIKTVFIIIRQCTRSATHASLVEHGMSIVRDMAKDECLVDSVFAVEDCVEVLVTCIQFYRDDEKILSITSETLLLLSRYRYGELLICADESIMHRINGVFNILQLHLHRQQKSEDRLRRADIIIDAVKRRREIGLNALPLSEEIQVAADRTSSSRSFGMQSSNRWLSELVSRFHMN